jgi:hypothetical protein
MKVLKPGQLPETQIYQAQCGYCRCEMEFTRGEAKFESTCRNEDYLKVNCPTCKREVWVQI